MVKVEVLAPGGCGATATLSLHFFFGKRFWVQVVAPAGNPTSCGLVGVTINATGLAKVMGDPFFAVLLRVNVKILPPPIVTVPKLWWFGLDFRCPGTGVGPGVGVDVAVGVAVRVGVGVCVGVGVGVAVRVVVAVAVGVAVRVAVGVAPVGVALGVGVADLVGVAETVGVALGVGVPAAGT